MRRGSAARALRSALQPASNTRSSRSSVGHPRGETRTRNALSPEVSIAGNAGSGAGRGLSSRPRSRDVLQKVRLALNWNMRPSIVCEGLCQVLPKVLLWPST